MSIRAVSRPSRLTRNDQPYEGPGHGRGGHQRSAEEGERAAIVELHRQGLSLHQLMWHFQRSRSFVQKTLIAAKRQAAAEAQRHPTRFKKGGKGS
jgi:hypothetical protein